MSKEIKPVGANKKHHFFRNLMITFLVIILVILALAGTFIGLCYDGTHKELNVKAGVSPDQVMTSLVFDSLDKTETEEKIDLELNEDDINQLLYSSYETLDQNMKQYVKQFYVEINEDKYTFYVEAGLSFLSTRLSIETTLSEYIDQNNKANNELRFTINDLKLGHLGGMYDLALSILGNFLNDQTLEGYFKTAGLNIKVDLKNKLLSYNEKQLLNDIKNLTSNDDIFYQFLNNFYDADLIKFNFKNSISAYIDLKALDVNNEYKNKLPSTLIDTKLKDTRSKVTTLLNEGVINEKHVNEMFKYLTVGYSGVDDFTKGYVSALQGLDVIGINDPTTYKGIDIKASNDISSLISNSIISNKDQIVQSIILESKNFEIARINEESLTNYFHTLNVLGTTFAFASKIADKNYKVAYMSLSDLYTNIVNDHLYIVLELDMNGYPLYIALDSSIKTNNMGFEIKVNDFLFGDIKMNLELKNYVFDLIKSALDGVRNITINSVSYSINFSLKGIFEEFGLLSIFENNIYNLNIKTLAQSFIENGEMIMSASRN